MLVHQSHLWDEGNCHRSEAVKWSARASRVEEVECGARRNEDLECGVHRGEDFKTSSVAPARERSSR